MSEQDPKHRNTDPSSPPSSSEPLPLQVSLEQVFSEQIRATQGNTAATLKLHALYLTLKDLLIGVESRQSEIHRLIGESRLEGTALAESFRQHTQAIKQLVAVVIDSRKSVDASRVQVGTTAQQLERVAKDIKDITGQHALLLDDGETPGWWAAIFRYGGKASWKHKTKIAAPVVIAGVAWLRAGPSIVEALKLLFREGL